MPVLKRHKKLMPGSLAWTRAVDEANRAANDARLGVVLKAGQEQNRIENLQEKRAHFHNQAQAQAHQQKMLEQQQPLHEILSLMQALSTPKASFQPYSSDDKPVITRLMEAIIK